MAGHNEWSIVQRLMGAFDAKRGKLFGKLAGETTFAALTGGGSPARDPRRLVAARAVWAPHTLHGQPAMIGDLEMRVGVQTVSATSSRRPKAAARGTHKAAPTHSLGQSAKFAGHDVRNARATVEFSNDLLINTGV